MTKDFAEQFKDVKNRRDMGDYFDMLMSSAYTSLKEQQEQEFGENLVKSYILELHNPEKKIDELNKFVGFLEKENFTIKELGGENLFLLNKNDATFFLDSFDPRFLLLHSPSKAEISREQIDVLVKKYPTLDRAWFNTSFLENLSYYGKFESWKTVYNSKVVFKQAEINAHEDLNWEELHFAIKTRDPRKKLQEIRESGIFDNIMPITSIRIKKSGKDDNFAREDISYLGKFTARGNNFSDHLDIVSEFSRIYATLVSKIESEYSLEFTGDLGLNGEPLVIEFPKITEEYFKLIVQNWFSGTMPFLLWGVIDFKSNDYAVVDAIDLHIGHRLSFEISTDFMRIYLSKGSCGNTITRLLANLEQHFRSSISIYNNKLDIFPKYNNQND